MPNNKKNKGGKKNNSQNKDKEQQQQQQQFNQAAIRAATSAARRNGGSFGILQAVGMTSTQLEGAATRVKQRLVISSSSSSSQQQQQQQQNDIIIWRVYIRRTNTWCGVDGCKKRRMEPKCRPWWITFILGDSLETVRTVMVEDANSVVAKNPAQHALTPFMFLAAMEVVMNDKPPQCHLPNKLILWPSHVFRIQSIHRFLQQLEPMLPPRNVLAVETLPDVSDPCDDRVGGCLMQAVLPYKTDTMDEQYWFAKSDVIDFIESQLQKMEHIMMENNSIGGYIPRSYSIPCLTQQHSSLTIYQLRLLFDAAKQFHDAKPWETLTNFDPVQVTVPINLQQLDDDHAGNNKQTMSRQYFCVVAGNGSWDARGVYFYMSWNDLILASSPHPPAAASMTAPPMEQYGLMYYARTWTPYMTLDHIEELGLALSTKDGSDGEESYPCWFSLDKLYGHMTEADHLKIGCNVPPVELLESMALAMLAITQFTMTSCRIMDGGARTELPYGSVHLDVGGLLVEKNNLACATTTAAAAAAAPQQRQRRCMVTVKCRSHEDASAFRYADVDSDKHMATLNLGDVRMCNYCQKPEKLIQQETGGNGRLLSCSRCKSIHYCSKRCQASDWPRHKKSECQPVVSTSN